MPAPAGTGSGSASARRARRLRRVRRVDMEVAVVVELGSGVRQVETPRVRVR